MLEVFLGAVIALAHQAAPRPDPLAQARRLLAAGSIDESIALLRDAIARQPESADAHLLLGTALSLVPKRTEAIAALEKAIRLARGRPPRITLWAWCTAASPNLNWPGARLRRRSRSIRTSPPPMSAWP